MGRLRAAAIFKLPDQPAPLHIVRRALVVVVQADLAAGNRLRLGQQPVQLGQHGVVDLRRVVRINPRARIEPRNPRAALGQGIELAANPERLVHLRRPLANADGQHRAHARLPRAPQHRRAVVRVARAVKVGMGIDQQRRTSSVKENSVAASF